MTWWTWRRYRSQTAWTLAPFALLAAWMLYTGRHMTQQYQHLGIAHCVASGGNCSDAVNAFLDSHHGYAFLIPLFLVTPALVGMFWGAPLLARELETGTYRLAWTQSVSRRRWLTAHLILVTTAVVVLAGLFAWLVSWWSGPLVGAGQDRIRPGTFDLRGIVPVGYTLFALALGVAAGVILRRTVPAMVATITSFAAVRLLVTLLLRPRYAHPVITTTPFDIGNGPSSSDWVLRSHTVDKFGHYLGSGNSINLNNVSHTCAPPGTVADKQGSMEACVHALGARVVATVQPVGRYWTFQTIETAIFLGLTAALIGLTYWWVTREVG
jgi:hypothetical protein